MQLKPFLLIFTFITMPYLGVNCFLFGNQSIERLQKQDKSFEDNKVAFDKENLLDVHRSEEIDESDQIEEDSSPKKALHGKRKAPDIINPSKLLVSNRGTTPMPLDAQVSEYEFNASTGFDDQYVTRTWTAGQHVYVIGEWYVNRTEDVMDFGIYGPGTNITEVLNAGYSPSDLVNWRMASAGGSPEETKILINETGTYYIRIINFGDKDVQGRVLTAIIDFPAASFYDHSEVFSTTAFGSLNLYGTSDITLSSCYAEEVYAHDQTQITISGSIIEKLVIDANCSIQGNWSLIRELIAEDNSTVHLNQSNAHYLYANDSSHVILREGHQGEIIGARSANVTLWDTRAEIIGIHIAGDPQAINASSLPRGFLSGWKLANVPESDAISLNYSIFNTEVLDWSFGAGENATVRVTDSELCLAEVFSNGTLYLENTNVTGHVNARTVVDDSGQLWANDSRIGYLEMKFRCGEANLSQLPWSYSASWNLTDQDVSEITINVSLTNVDLSLCAVNANGDSIVRIDDSHVWRVGASDQGTLYVNDSSAAFVYANESGFAYSDNIIQYNGYDAVSAAGSGTHEVYHSQIMNAYSYDHAKLHLYNCTNSTAIQYSTTLSAYDYSCLEINESCVYGRAINGYDDSTITTINCSFFYRTIQANDHCCFKVYNTTTTQRIELQGQAELDATNYTGSLYFYGGCRAKLNRSIVTEFRSIFVDFTENIGEVPGNGFITSFSSFWYGLTIIDTTVENPHWIRIFGDSRIVMSGPSAGDVQVSVYDNSVLEVNGGHIGRIELEEEFAANIINTNVSYCQLFFDADQINNGSISDLHPLDTDMTWKLVDHSLLYGLSCHLNVSSSTIHNFGIMIGGVADFEIKQSQLDSLFITESTLLGLQGNVTVDYCNISCLSLYHQSYCYVTSSNASNILLYEQTTLQAHNLGFDSLLVDPEAQAFLYGPFSLDSESWPDGIIAGSLTVQLELRLKADPSTVAEVYHYNDSSIKWTSNTNLAGWAAVYIPVDWWPGSLQWGVQINVTGRVNRILYSGSTYLNVTGTILDLTATGQPIPDTNAPAIDHPSSTTYESGSKGNNITWSPQDVNPANYTIYRNKTNIGTYDWFGEDIVVNIDDLPLGTYNFTIIVTDLFANWASDAVWVTVIDTIPPTIDHPSDLIYEENTLNHFITWQLSDVNPSNYTVYLNGTNVAAGSWRASSISVNVTGLSVGLYNCSLTIFDLAGNSNSDIVWITVLPDITPPIIRIISPTNTTYNSSGISVMLSGDAVHYWYSLIGPISHGNVSWIAALEENGLINGKYTLFAYGNDSVGNEACANVTFVIYIEKEAEKSIEDDLPLIIFVGAALVLVIAATVILLHSRLQDQINELKRLIRGRREREW